MINGSKVLDHSIRWAMVGGGKGSQIGYIHRSAALRDNNFELVAEHYTEGDKEGIQINLFQHDKGYTAKTPLSNFVNEAFSSRRT